MQFKLFINILKHLTKFINIVFLINFNNSYGFISNPELISNPNSKFTAVNCESLLKNLNNLQMFGNIYFYYQNTYWVIGYDLIDSPIYKFLSTGSYINSGIIDGCRYNSLILKTTEQTEMESLIKIQNVSFFYNTESYKCNLCVNMVTINTCTEFDRFIKSEKENESNNVFYFRNKIINSDKLDLYKSHGYISEPLFKYTINEDSTKEHNIFLDSIYKPTVYTYAGCTHNQLKFKNFRNAEQSAEENYKLHDILFLKTKSEEDVRKLPKTVMESLIETKKLDNCEEYNEFISNPNNKIGDKIFYRDSHDSLHHELYYMYKPNDNYILSHNDTGLTKFLWYRWTMVKCIKIKDISYLSFDSDYSIKLSDIDFYVDSNSTLKKSSLNEQVVKSPVIPDLSSTHTTTSEVLNQEPELQKKETTFKDVIYSITKDYNEMNLNLKNIPHPDNLKTRYALNNSHQLSCDLLNYYLADDKSLFSDDDKKFLLLFINDEYYLFIKQERHLNGHLIKVIKLVLRPFGQYIWVQLGYYLSCNESNLFYTKNSFWSYFGTSLPEQFAKSSITFEKSTSKIITGVNTPVSTSGIYNNEILNISAQYLSHLESLTPIEDLYELEQLSFSSLKNIINDPLVVYERFHSWEYGKVGKYLLLKTFNQHKGFYFQLFKWIDNRWSNLYKDSLYILSNYNSEFIEFKNIYDLSKFNLEILYIQTYSGLKIKPGLSQQHKDEMIDLNRLRRRLVEKFPPLEDNRFEKQLTYSDMAEFSRKEDVRFMIFKSEEAGKNGQYLLLKIKYAPDEEYSYLYELIDHKWKHTVYRLSSFNKAFIVFKDPDDFSENRFKILDMKIPYDNLSLHKNSFDTEKGIEMVATHK